MKRRVLVLAVAVLLLFSGCNFKVDRDTFYLPQEDVKSVELQREYHYEEDQGSYFRHKVVTNQEDLRMICEKIRTLPVRRVSSEGPHPIKEFSMIIIISGKREHHLILNEEIAFYDQIAYEYKDSGVYEEFIELYNNLGYAEEDAEPDRF